MKSIIFYLLIAVTTATFAEELDPEIIQNNIENTERYPPYKTDDELNERPVQNSLLGLGGLSTFYYRDQFLINMVLTGELYLRDWMSIRGSLLIPFQRTNAKDALQTITTSSRLLPVLLRAGGAMHFWSPGQLDFYLPMMSGFEINRNDADKHGYQMFVELGGGAQIFLSSFIVMRLEYAYHFSYIPQTNNSFLDYYYHRLETTIGFYF